MKTSDLEAKIDELNGTVARVAGKLQVRSVEENKATFRANKRIGKRETGGGKKEKNGEGLRGGEKETQGSTGKTKERGGRSGENRGKLKTKTRSAQRKKEEQ